MLTTTPTSTYLLSYTLLPYTLKTTYVTDGFLGVVGKVVRIVGGWWVVGEGVGKGVVRAKYGKVD